MGAKAHTLSEFLPGRENNLNLIRVLAAAAVLVSHAFPITTGVGTPEPLEEMTGLSLGGYAVAVFFVLSGLLIARSFDRATSRTRFVLARVMRLFPGLLIVLVLTVVAGAMVTTLRLEAYLTDPATIRYIPGNLSLFFLQYDLPGVLAGNPNGTAINGSLWTLFYEVVCYCGVFVIGMLGLLRRRGIVLAGFAGIAAAFLVSLGWQPSGGLAYRLDLLMHLAFPFYLGVLAYVWRDRLIIDGKIALVLWVAALIACTTEMLLLPVAIISIGYTTIWFGYSIKTRLLIYNRVGDYSYGLYIYAFPIQQLIVYFWPGMSPFQNTLLALPITLVLAALSWVLVEQRALAMIDPIARLIECRFIRQRKIVEGGR